MNSNDYGDLSTLAADDPNETQQEETESKKTQESNKDALGVFPPKKRKLSKKSILMLATVSCVGLAWLTLDLNDFANFMGTKEQAAFDQVDTSLEVNEQPIVFSDIGPDSDTGNISSFEATSDFNTLANSFNTLSEESRQAAEALQVALENTGTIEEMSNILSTLQNSVLTLMNRPNSDPKVEEDLDQVKEYLIKVHDKTTALSGEVKTLSASVSNNTKTITRLLKKELAAKKAKEAQKTKIAKINKEKTIKKARKATPAVQPRTAWVLKAADYKKKIAMIYNVQTRQKLTVGLQSNIPNCGKVMDIDISKKHVKTSNCEIKRT